MEQYILNGQVITDLTTATEGNALIMRKGKTSLLAAKVMLFALLNVENRNSGQYNIEDLQYYSKLSQDTGVDYSKGIVSEIAISDLKKLLKKENSGSFYASLRELFSIDPYQEKSLRNSWAVMLPISESGVLGYAEVITACHYDTANGRLFIKFSNEDFVRSQLWQIKSSYTELPFLHMINIKSIYTYRLYEIIYSEISKTDLMLKENGDWNSHSEYSFRFSVGELQLMLGALDVTTDKIGKKSIATKDPDYNAIAADINTRQYENMGEYRSFRRYSLDVATKEINNTDSSAFTIRYDVEKDETGKRVSYVVFYVKKKNSPIYVEAEFVERNEEQDDFIVSLARELGDFSLKFNELQNIAKASDYDMELIKAALTLYNGMKITEPFSSWFLEFRK